MMSPALTDLFSPKAPTPGPSPTVVTPTKVVHVDPELAAQWLERNESNRNLRPGRVSQYAADMAAGHWFHTGETIKFDNGDNLIDGQHRLRAVIEANVTVTLLVTFGLDPEARHYVDTGAARTAQDALRMKGEQAPAILGAAARLGMLAERNVRNTRVSHAAVFDYIQAHPGLREASVYAQNVLHKIDVPPSVIAYGRFRFAEVDADAAEEFFGKLSRLNDLGADDPILRLAQRLRAMVRNAEKVDKHTITVTLFRTWNTWRQGKTLQRLLIAAPDAPLPPLV